MSILSAPDTILNHVVAIRSSHRRLTGLELPWPDAIRLLDRYNSMLDDDMPPKIFEIRIGCFLLQEGYTAEAIRRVIAVCAIHGSAKHSEDLDADDVEAVDMLIPTR